MSQQNRDVFRFVEKISQSNIQQIVGIIIINIVIAQGKIAFYSFTFLCSSLSLSLSHLRLLVPSFLLHLFSLNTSSPFFPSYFSLTPIFVPHFFLPSISYLFLPILYQHISANINLSVSHLI